MNGKAIIYPYWENVARGYEDILTVVTLFELLFLLYAVILALVFFCIWWKHKGWTIREKWLILKDKAERKGEILRAKRLAAKGNPEELEYLSEFEQPERDSRRSQKKRKSKNRKAADREERKTDTEEKSTEEIIAE